jgi:hypothetical protein
MVTGLFSYVVVSTSPNTGWAILVCCKSENQANIWKRQFEEGRAAEGLAPVKIDVIAVPNLCRKLT